MANEKSLQKEEMVFSVLTRFFFLFRLLIRVLNTRGDKLFQGVHEINNW